MINYPERIYQSGLSIYDPIDQTDNYLYIQLFALESILSVVVKLFCNTCG